MMSRIEEALAKVRRENAQSDSASVRRGVARSPEAEAVPEPRQHNYGGKRLDIKFDKLREQGLLAPDMYERKLAEEYRILKRPLIKNARKTPDALVPRGNILLVTSAIAGEGKTFTSVNLSLSISRDRDWSVVLVDADCQKPHLTRLFGAEREPGLIELLRNPDMSFDSLVMPTNIPGLSLLPAGAQDKHASELLASSRMGALAEHLATADVQRMVIFDSAPLLLTSETVALASHVGQVLLVVSACKTSQQSVVSARNLLDSDMAISLLLNQVARGGGAEQYGQYGHYGQDSEPG